ncbi:MAG TPA: phosphoribosylanthranilate isomerase [Vicinamibacterales bacterium]|nr:phosphoribosylanthranilate isomerase [Vicinamibacterales bacterium]
MTPDPLIKVCGITRAEDARHAVAHGATALGFVFWPSSPRYIVPEAARAIVAGLPRGVVAVGVFVNETIDGIRRAVEASGVTAVQLHGDEPPDYARALDGMLLRAVGLEAAAAAVAIWPRRVTLLIDAADPVRRGGTGMLVDWQKAADLARRRSFVLAGGLTPDNVADAIRLVRPAGVDVSSGVERAPGIKDAEKVTAFVASARRAFAALAGAGRVT